MRAGHPLLMSAVVAAVVMVTTGCGSRSGRADEIVVFAAASLTGAFSDLGAAFTEIDPDTTVTVNVAASSELVAQILDGAPADVFASADPATMTRLTDAGAHATEPVVFARNDSMIVVAAGNPLGITAVDDLANDDLVLVVCTPDAPCGRYAAGIFDRAGIAPTPDSYEANPRAVLNKVALGEADAGIVYTTDVRAAGDAVRGVVIPDDMNIVAEYPIAVTAEAPDPDGARAFVDFVLSPTGQDILAAHGFTSP